MNSKNGFHFRSIRSQIVITLGMVSVLPTIMVGIVSIFFAFRYSQQNELVFNNYTFQVILISLIQLVITALIAYLGGIYLTGKILTPIREISSQIDKITRGEYTQETNYKSRSEIGVLSRLESQISGLIKKQSNQLKLLVSERTHDINQQLDILTIALDTMREVTAAYTIEDATNRFVDSLVNKFGFDHASLYLLDGPEKPLALVSAAGTSAENILSQNIKIPSSSPQLLSSTIRTSLGKIAGDDDLYMLNPLLAKMKSRMVIPLSTFQQMIGVIDIYSVSENKFSQDTLDIVQTIADQLARTIESIRYTQQIRQELSELKSTGERNLTQFWSKIKQETGNEKTALSSDANPVGISFEQTGSDEKDLDYDLSIPLISHNQEIGTIVLNFDQEYQDPNMVLALNEMAHRLTSLMENSRLIMDANELAQREQKINRLVSNVKGTANIDSILQNTVREIGQLFGAKRTFIQIGMSESSEEQLEVGK